MARKTDLKSAASAAANSTKTDGRVLRGERNRAAIVDALLALLEEGDPNPAAATIAARAGVSVRSVYMHFDDMETLYGALIQRQYERVSSALQPVDVALPFAERLDAFLALRSAVYERITPIRRATLVLASGSKTLQDALALAASVHEQEVAHTFAPELERAGAPNDAGAAVTLALSWDTWNRLRSVQRCSPAQAKRVVTRLVTAILAPGAS